MSDTRAVTCRKAPRWRTPRAIAAFARPGLVAVATTAAVLAGALLIPPASALSPAVDPLPAHAGVAPHVGARIPDPGCENRLAEPGYRPARSPERIFIGVRGSGESPRHLDGLGTRSAALLARLREQSLYGPGMACTAAVLTAYEARGIPRLDDPTRQWRTFVDDMLGNADALAVPLTELSRKYPRARFVISGFSKGAVIAQLGVAKAVQEDPDLARRIDALVLVSSPLADTTDPRIRVPGDVNWVQPRAGVVTVASSVVSTEGRAIAVRLALGFISRIHGWIPRQCVLPGCQSLKRISLEVDRRRPPVETMLDSIVQAHRAGALSRSNSVQALRRVGVPVTTVCYTGDAVCAPIGRRGGSPWFSSATHSRKYSEDRRWAQAVAESIARRQERLLAASVGDGREVAQGAARQR